MLSQEGWEIGSEIGLGTRGERAIGPWSLASTPSGAHLARRGKRDGEKDKKKRKTLRFNWMMCSLPRVQLIIRLYVKDVEGAKVAK